jgi:hypothetical protein
MPEHIPHNSRNRRLPGGPNVVIEYAGAKVHSGNYDSRKGPDPPSFGFGCLQRSAVSHDADL